MDAWMDGCMDARMDGWMDGKMYMNGRGSEREKGLYFSF